jgi:hypothetical protein
LLFSFSFASPNSSTPKQLPALVLLPDATNAKIPQVTPANVPNVLVDTTPWLRLVALFALLASMAPGVLPRLLALTAPLVLSQLPEQPPALLALLTPGLPPDNRLPALPALEPPP